MESLVNFVGHDFSYFCVRLLKSNEHPFKLIQLESKSIQIFLVTVKDD